MTRGRKPCPRPDKAQYHTRAAALRESPQLTTQPLDVLDDLDWTAIVCQNHRRKCDHEATLIVEWHAIDHCNETGHPDGNLVELLCQQCLEWLQHEVDRFIGKLKRIPGQRACRTCGTPIAESSDVLRSVRPLA
jgi:hypothetical protein